MSPVLMVGGSILIIVLLVVVMAMFFSFSSIITVGTEAYISKPIQKNRPSIWSRMFVKIQRWRYRRLFKKYHSPHSGVSPREDLIKRRYQKKMLDIARTLPQTPEEERSQRISLAVGNLALDRPEKSVEDIARDVAFADKELNR